MKKIVFILLSSIVSSSVFADDFLFINYLCESKDMSLSISQIPSDGDGILLQWEVLDLLSSQLLISGKGPFHKETESSDAFSAYDEKTAISFKNNRAVFVLPNGQAFLFSNCQ